MGAQVFESKGQVKVTQKKRKFSEHASSIGSEEQNLDMPERLKSSQASESNEPTSGTCITAAQGFQHRGKRMIFVSSKQSGVPGVSWQS